MDLCPSRYSARRQHFPAEYATMLMTIAERLNTVGKNYRAPARCRAARRHCARCIRAAPTVAVSGPSRKPGRNRKGPRQAGRRRDWPRAPRVEWASPDVVSYQVVMSDRGNEVLLPRRRLANVLRFLGYSGGWYSSRTSSAFEILRLSLSD